MQIGSFIDDVLSVCVGMYVCMYVCMVSSDDDAEQQKDGAATTAVTYLERAAEAGDLRAIKKMAALYEHGLEGVLAKDTRRAGGFYRYVGR